MKICPRCKVDHDNETSALCEHCAKHAKVNRACANCGSIPASRPRGLCWTCYYAPGVREKFESGAPTAHRGVPNPKNSNRLLMPKPTDALPGTEAKALVLEQRAERGERLWHPDDATYATE